MRPGDGKDWTVGWNSSVFLRRTRLKGKIYHAEQAQSYMHTQYASAAGTAHVIEASSCLTVWKDLNDEVFNTKVDTPMSPTKKTKRTVEYMQREEKQREESARIDLKRMRLDDEDR